ncbi:cytochrome P450 [uncultured Deinococcus sp.]|uniref:cytochrome P450 n=1 Tax=uncultured Deinococcus sp. TaxID=158789 RepID=UPI0025E13882|nr:cytochrome P450 [uncultured Deinococcus sp.]
MTAAPGPFRPPGPRSRSPLGQARVLRADPLGYMRHLRVAYGDVLSFRVGPREILLVSDPAAAREVLVDKAASFRKGRGIQKMRDFLGSGLLTAEGAEWRTHRRLMQPAFHRPALAGMAADIVAATRPTLERLHGAAQAGEPVELGGEMLRVTLRAISAVLFGTGLSDAELEVVERELPPLLERTTQRVRAVVDLPAHWPTPANRRATRAGAALDTVVARIIAQRRAAPEPGSDLLGLLLAARDEDGGGGLTDAEVRDEVMTLFLAGHETTANLLTFLFLEFARHPDVQARARAEVRAVLAGRDPDAADARALPYVNACIQEALRLYPPAWIVPRQATEPVTVAGYDLPAGANVSVNIFLMQRSARFWPRPAMYDPQRWLVGARTPDAFMPFGAGARMCIGNHLALLEATLITAALLQGLHYDVPGGGPTGLHPGVTLKPGGPVDARVSAVRE